VCPDGLAGHMQVRSYTVKTVYRQIQAPTWTN
jgi:hypothetical protein